ncbi:acid-sensing ion channel 4-B-like [Liolophura sinensis]|uniref:acid-sensing ion channel 4-B-like n=1 Tax=Liolophura sinensis TaxID=3198878 RepID=UPI0031588232
MKPEKVSQSPVVKFGEPQREVREIFKAFTENATVHGLKYTTPESGRGIARRIVWTLAFLATVGCLIYTVSIQVVELRNRPTLTQVSVEFKEQMLFPAVTLCSLNKARKSALPEGIEDAIKMVLLRKSSLAYTLNQTEFMSNFEIMEEDFEYVAHGIFPTLQSCSWDNIQQNCTDLFLTVKTDMGYCFSFNHRSSNADPRISKRTGNKYGLTVIANIQQDEYLVDSNTESAGLRVLLHGYNETPLVESRGFDVAPGKATKVSLDMMTVKNLPPPYTTLDGSTCMEMSNGESPKTLALFEEYDLNACRFECRHDYIFSECQCRTSYDPDKFMAENGYKNCSCLPPCEWSMYTPRVSMGDYPSLALMDMIDNEESESNFTQTQYRQNFLKLTITFDQFLLETVKQVPKFSSESIVSTLGGQMGMFLGASLLSAVEFLDFLLQLVLTKIRKRSTTSPEK